MKNFGIWKKILIFVVLIMMELIIYGCVDKYIKYEKWNRSYTTQNEFLKTIDCAELFDANPNRSFLITFEIRAKEDGNIMVYQQNGSGARYEFYESIEVTQEYQKFQIIVTPMVKDLEKTESYLAFYGQYGSGVIPEVRRLTIEVFDK